MYKIKIFSVLLCAIIMLSCFTSCEASGDAKTTPPTAENTTSAQVNETTSLPEQDTTSTEETTAEAITAEVTTSAPEPTVEPMQIAEYYKITATTEFPLIASLGGEKTEVTVRAATMRSKYDVHWIYVDVVLDGKIIFTKTWRAIGQLMATYETSEHFVLLRIPDNSSSGTANTTFETLSVSDADGKVELIRAGQNYSSMSVGLNTQSAQPMDHAAQSGQYRRFLNGIKIEDFENQNSRLCAVLDSISDPENEAGAYPSDALPIYNLEALGEHTFYIKLKEQFVRFENLKSNLSSLDTLAPQIPEGMSITPYTLACSDANITLDGVNYKVATRTFTLQDAQGNPCGQYTDYVSHYDMSIISFEIKQ